LKRSKMAVGQVTCQHFSANILSVCAKFQSTCFRRSW
jgi:hypothetical protein